MPMSIFVFALAKAFYPLPPPPEKRIKELKVICCGLPRSATESLHNALGILGYTGVSHGFPWWIRHVNYSTFYYQLAILRALGQTPDAKTLREEYFHRILGDCEATTDVPTVWFCEELLAAYPNAKVILNRRKDAHAWKESFRGSVLPMLKDWNYWTWSWFNAELFWGMALTYEMHSKQLFNGDFEQNAESAYIEHFEKLERGLDRHKRPYLKWSIEDGWASLCEFLDRPVPTGAFPHGNVAAEFIPKLMVVDEERMRRAKRNAVLVVGTIISIAVAMVLPA